MLHLQSDAELARAYPVLRQLRTHLDEAEFIRRVREGEEKAGYRLFALEDGADDIVALCGVQPMITLYYDRCLWVSELVTAEGRRSQGWGKKILSEVEDWARENGYREIALSSGVQRLDAHRFYEEKMGFRRASHQFSKKL